MKVTDEALLNSGFTPSDLQKIKNNIQSYGGTLGNAIRDLARRFVLTMWVVSGCLAVFIFLMVFASEESVFSGGIGLSCGIAVAIFIQPPLLAYKSWRFCRANKN
jgi:membrane protein YdbS with pleckstrin-like domain